MRLYTLSYFVAMVVAQVVAHQTTDREVPNSIPTGSWAFISSLLFPLNQWCVLNQVQAVVQHYWFSIFQEKMEA